MHSHLSTGEDINGGLAVFRPRVNGQMRFHNHYHAADTGGTKFVEGNICYRVLGLPCRRNYCVLDLPEVLENLWVTVPQFHQ